MINNQQSTSTISDQPDQIASTPLGAEALAKATLAP
jgi:hypothetical protein